MEDLPVHVGRVIVDETGYALVCSWEGDGPLCGDRAVWHVMWTDDGENSLCCNKHRAGALALDPVEVHSTFDSACGMPDSVWLRVERRCVMDLLDDEPVPAACEKETV